MNNEFYKPNEIATLFGVSTRTIYNWEKQGILKACYLPNNNIKRFSKRDVEHHFRGGNERRKVCYCRVSTASQKEDLHRQVEYFKLNYPEHEIIRDLGSGLNFKRKGFNALIQDINKGLISEVVVTHKDRLCRFGYELVESLLQHQGGKIVVLNQTNTSPNEELVKDLISIVTVFSSRLYGLRSSSIKKQIKESNKTEEGDGNEIEDCEDNVVTE